MATAKGKKIGVNVSVTREVALTNSKGSSPNVFYFPTDSDTIIFNGKEYSDIDKEQIAKIPGIEAVANDNAYYTTGVWNDNMDTCIYNGFYPWCTSGRPPGAKGAFSLSVRRTANPDFNGNYTMLQTAYGREGDEEGQVWMRLVFKPIDYRASYMDWVRVDNLNSDKVYAFGNVYGLSTSSTVAQIKEVLGSYNDVINACKNNKVFIAYTETGDKNGSNDYTCVYQVNTGSTNVEIKYMQGDVIRSLMVRHSNGEFTSVASNNDKMYLLVMDNLYSGITNVPLSANQGRILDGKISTINKTLTNTPKVYVINGTINAWSQLPTAPALQDALENFFDAPADFVAAAMDEKTIIVDKDGNPIDVTIEGQSDDDVTLYTIDLYKNVRNDDGEIGTAWLEIIAYEYSDNTWDWTDDYGDIIYEKPTYLSDKIISVKDTNWRLTLNSFTTGSISNNLVSALKGGSVTSIKANVDAGKAYMYNGIPLSIQVDSSYNWYIQFMYNGKIIMQNFNTTDNRGGTKSIDINTLGS